LASGNSGQRHSEKGFDGLLAPSCCCGVCRRGCRRCVVGGSEFAREGSPCQHPSRCLPSGSHVLGAHSRHLRRCRLPPTRRRPHSCRSRGEAGSWGGTCPSCACPACRACSAAPHSELRSSLPRPGRAARLLSRRSPLPMLSRERCRPSPSLATRSSCRPVRVLLSFGGRGRRAG
jgi:hypothetical protein